MIIKTAKLVILTILLLLFGVSPVFASSVVINEIMANPPSGEKEWIELYNNSSSDINLNGWSVQEKTSSGTFNDYALPSVILSSNSLCFYEFSTAKLNNDGDTVNVLNSNGTQQDSYSYTNTMAGKTFSRIPDGGSWNTQANPSKTTLACSSLTTSSTSSPSPSPTSSSSPSPSSTSSTSSSSSFTISNVPSTIDSTETFNASVNLSLSDKSNTIFYLKGAFKQKDGTNYFGQTKVNGSWIKNNKTYSDQYKITTDSSGNWSGNLEIQPDIMDSGYEGAGEYIFKAGRYSEDGSLNWSNESNIKINAQEIVLDNEDSNILGINEEKQATKTTKSKIEELSLEKYIKVSSPSSRATPSANSKAETKGTKQTNFLSIVGGILVIIGAVPISYAIYNKFRKRNKGFS